MSGRLQRKCHRENLVHTLNGITLGDPFSVTGLRLSRAEGMSHILVMTLIYMVQLACVDAKFIPQNRPSFNPATVAEPF